MQYPRLLFMYGLTSLGKRCVMKQSLRLCGVETCTGPVKEMSQIPELCIRLFPLFTSRSQREKIGIAFRFLGKKQWISLIYRLVEVALTRAVDFVVTSPRIPTRKSYLLFSLALRLHYSRTATMVARIRRRRAGQNFLSSALLHQR